LLPPQELVREEGGEYKKLSLTIGSYQTVSSHEDTFSQSTQVHQKACYLMSEAMTICRGTSTSRP